MMMAYYQGDRLKEMCGDVQKKTRSTLKTLPTVVEAIQNAYQKPEEVNQEFDPLHLP